METGASYTSCLTVRPSDTAVSLGSGDLPVLATPAMIALMENAAMRLAASSLPDSRTTVGAHIESTHLRPSAIGEAVKATATLLQVEGRKLVFSVSASDSKGIIGEGKHTRYVVDAATFLSKIQ